jgi:hypothetical protein
MRFSLVTLLVLFLGVSGLNAAQVDIADFLKKSQENAWTTSPEEFKKKNGPKWIYRWNSAQKKYLHYAANRFGIPLYFLKWQVAEADFHFENRQLNSISLNIYNKLSVVNKQAAKSKNDFLEFLDKFRSSLDAFCQTKHSKISVQLINSARCQSCFWDSPSAYVVFKWSYEGSGKYNFTADYATVYIYKDKDVFSEKNSSKVAELSYAELKKRIKTDSNGDRYLQIPMVDQGLRGYCVVACAERILKYYNANVDQHILAEASGTSGGGTRIAELESSMKRIGTKCNFHVKEVCEYSPLVGNFNILKFIKKYNRHAKRAGKKEVNVQRIKSYKQLFRLMDEDILVKTKIDYDKSGYKKFKQRVKENIDNGIPVLWGVMLGMVKEAKIPQNMGGHMRLINGYNPDTEEIIYSDSWGKGHDFKKMSWGKAWAMTQLAYVFIPKNIK